MNPIIKKALVCLENANYAGYFEELDKVSMPSILKNPYATHKGKFIAGKYDWILTFYRTVRSKRIVR